MPAPLHESPAVTHLVPSVLRMTHGPVDSWWAGLVSARAAGARFCVDGYEEGIRLESARRVERLVELVASVAPGLGLLGACVDPGGEEAALVGGEDGRTLLISAREDSARFVAWGADLAEVRALVRAVCRALPRTTHEVGEVPIAFWRAAGQAEAVDVDVRGLACPTLESIAANYVPRVREGLLRLAALERPDESGKIVLWHGPPGTGKTHAARALARAWSERLGVSVEVVIDPERLFASSHYLHELLLSDQRARRLGRRRRSAQDGLPDDEAPTPAEQPMRLVLLEDAAELFSSGCRSTQGFARFLNLTDGVLGQGRRIVFLLTTNEPLGRIDPALTRSGRCVQALEFEPFDAEAGAAWLAARGCPDVVPAERTLSDLFAVAAAAPPVLALAGRLGF